MSLVLPRLYLSGMELFSGKTFVRLNISHVLNASDTLTSYPSYMLNPHNILFLNMPDIPQKNSSTLIARCDEIVSFIASGRRAKRSNVLVHCVVGVSRSVSCVILYLVRKFKMPAVLALDYIRIMRPTANPSPTFMADIFKMCKVNASLIPLLPCCNLREYLFLAREDPHIDQTDLSFMAQAVDRFLPQPGFPQPLSADAGTPGDSLSDVLLLAMGAADRMPSKRQEARSARESLQRAAREIYETQSLKVRSQTARGHGMLMEAAASLGATFAETGTALSPSPVLVPMPPPRKRKRVSH